MAQSPSMKTKETLLGEPLGTANHRLRKSILFDLIQKLELDYCYRCRDRIDDIAHLSIEHKKP
jgi:hypothetical protein